MEHLRIATEKWCKWRAYVYSTQIAHKLKIKTEVGALREKNARVSGRDAAHLAFKGKFFVILRGIPGAPEAPKAFWSSRPRHEPLKSCQGLRRITKKRYIVLFFIAILIESYCKP
jgi:hypothetical protein